MRPLLVKLSVGIFAFAVWSMVVCSAGICEPVCSPSQRPLSEPSPAESFLDALFYRPVGLVLIPVGTVLFVVTVPFSAAGGNVGTSFDNLVTAPVEFTFCRPLGDI